MRQRLLKTSRISSKTSSRIASRTVTATAGELTLTIISLEMGMAAVREMDLTMMDRTVILIPAIPSNTFSIIIDYQ